MTDVDSRIPRELIGTLPSSPAEERNWQFTVFPDWQKTFLTIADACALISQPTKILQQHNRGIVLLIQQHEKQFIAKRSLTQETRWWAQLTSIYRDGEGARTLHSMQQLHELGLPVPEPVLILEKKRWGLTVASWAVYRYLKGETCSFAHSAQIARTLKALHEKGWVHRDPHVWNFLLHHGEIRILDCARARSWNSRYAKMYDVVLLDKCSSGSAEQYGVSERDWVYRLAKFHNRGIQSWRKIKRKVRFWRVH